MFDSKTTSIQDQSLKHYCLQNLVYKTWSFPDLNPTSAAVPVQKLVILLRT